MTEMEKIIEAVDSYISRELRKQGGHMCLRSARMLEDSTGYSAAQIGLALGKHPGMSQYEIEYEEEGIWRFKR